DPRCEPRAQVGTQRQIRRRSVAARRESPLRRAQPVALVEQRDLLRLAEPADVVGGDGVAPRRRRGFGESTQQMRLAAPARSPEEDETVPARERVAQGLYGGAAFPRPEILRGGRRGRSEFEQQLLHSIRILQPARNFIRKPLSWPARSRSPTATQGWTSTRATPWSRRSSLSRRGRCARRC